MINSLRAISIFSVLMFSFISEAMEIFEHKADKINLANMPEHRLDILPSGYKHFPVQTQIRNYRKIYDQALAHAGEAIAFSKTHVDGLFVVLQNGFALVQDDIRNDQCRGDDDKKKYLDMLRNVYVVAVTLETQSNMTMKYFVSINLFMAYIAQSFHELGMIWPRKGCFHDRDLFLEKPFDSLDTIWISRIFSYSVVDDFLSSQEDFPRPMIIYTNRGSTISPSTFVEQGLHHDYRGCLALFDITSKTFEPKITERTQNGIKVALEHEITSRRIYPKVDGKENRDKFGTNSDPHYSTFNGTYCMLWHDLAHMIEQESVYSGECGQKFLKSLQKINENIRALDTTFLDSDARKNFDIEFQIIINGLYICSHEYYNASGSLKILGDSNFNEIINDLCASMLEHTCPEYEYARSLIMLSTPTLSVTEGYFRDYRDHEYILKSTKNADGTPLFLPVDFRSLSRNQKQQEVYTGFAGFWHRFNLIVETRFLLF